MKEYPILFQTEMVQAIEPRGVKWQTRRTTKLDEVNKNPKDWKYLGCIVNSEDELINQFLNVKTNSVSHLKCPYGGPGSVLWVRETWARIGILNAFKGDTPNAKYPGGVPDYRHSKDVTIKWKPSIHMPKDACRIYLQNTGVRVQRLQDIDEFDAIAEGVNSFRPVPGDGPAETLYYHYTKNKWGPSPVHSFQTLIQKINGAEIWDKNPWVRAISFRILSTTGRPSNLDELCAGL